MTLEGLQAKWRAQQTTPEVTEDPVIDITASATPETPAEKEIFIPYGNPAIGVYDPDFCNGETPRVETFPEQGDETRPYFEVLEEGARYFTQRNIAVLPTKGKAPDTIHGCKDATLSQTGIVYMLRERERKGVENLGIGVDCEKSGLFFLDV